MLGEHGPYVVAFRGARTAAVADPALHTTQKNNNTQSNQKAKRAEQVNQTNLVSRRLGGRPAVGLGEPGLTTLLRPREVEDGNEEEGVAVKSIALANPFIPWFFRCGSKKLGQKLGIFLGDGSGAPWLGLALMQGSLRRLGADHTW
jgi:hypothetical protein